MHAADLVGVEVGVDLGRADRGVAQHLLDRAQVGAAGDEVAGEAVAQGVGADVGRDAGAQGEGLDAAPGGDAVEGTFANQMREGMTEAAK